MISAGVRELKNSLPRYLRLVERGESVLVTNHSRTVAILKKPDLHASRSQEEKVAAMVAQGRLLPAEKPGRLEAFKPIKVKGKAVSKMVVEGRK